MKDELIQKKLLKLARDAFETASTLLEDERIEVYLENGEAKISSVLQDDEVIVYTPTRILCYEVHGHNFLEDEIKTWIDYAREEQVPSEDKVIAEPTVIEKSIRELLSELAKQKGVLQEQISSYEIFANLPVNLLGSIEHEIIEYWWSANEEENGKKLASEQIEAALLEYN